jgi:hypothetical protein
VLTADKHGKIVTVARRGRDIRQVAFVQDDDRDGDRQGWYKSGKGVIIWIVNLPERKIHECKSPTPQIHGLKWTDLKRFQKAGALNI